MADSPRAVNNRTLTLSDEDRGRLSSRLLSAQDLRNASREDILDRTVCADILEAAELLPSGFADLVIADPPYNMTRDFGSGRFRAMDPDRYAEWTESWLSRVKRLLSPAGSMYVCCDWRSSGTVQRVLERHMTVMNRITWQREKGRGAARNWKSATEDIWFAVMDPARYSFDLNAVKLRRRVLAPYRSGGKPKDWVQESDGRWRDTCPSNFWDDLSVPFWSMPENTDHPTQKPEKLMAKLILASCPEGGTVFDPFGGSGTAAVTARKLNRHFCSVEIDASYAALTELRLERALSDRRIQGYHGGVFWERNTQAAQRMEKRTKE